MTERSLDPGASQVVGPVELARLYGKSRKWAARLLREWWAEQQAGGEVRVFRRRHPRGEWAYLTTRAALHRHMPPARDVAIVRQVAGLEADLDRAVARLNELQRRVEMLERRAPPSVAAGPFARANGRARP